MRKFNVSHSQRRSKYICFGNEQTNKQARKEGRNVNVDTNDEMWMHLKHQKSHV